MPLPDYCVALAVPVFDFAVQARHRAESFITGVKQLDLTASQFQQVVTIFVSPGPFFEKASDKEFTCWLLLSKLSDYDRCVIGQSIGY